MCTSVIVLLGRRSLYCNFLKSNRVRLFSAFILQSDVRLWLSKFLLYLQMKIIKMPLNQWLGINYFKLTALTRSNAMWKIKYYWSIITYSYMASVLCDNIRWTVRGTIHFSSAASANSSFFSSRILLQMCMCSVKRYDRVISIR